MSKTKQSYTAAPTVAPQMTERLGVMLEVLAGRRTVSEAARTLGMSRNHFQTLLHRGLGAMVESITPQAPGRPAKPQEIAALQDELARLKRENARLQERVGTTDRLLQAASGLLQGRIRPVRQSRRKKAATSTDEDEAEPRRERRLAEIEQMRRCGLTASFAAQVAGVHASTVRRWKRHEAAPRAARRGLVATDAARQVGDIVRSLHGQVGAESLCHSVAGISRREAARVKACTLVQMERERKAALTRVRVSVPGIVRGMDGMHLRGVDGCLHALITADAAVPYRTHVKIGTHYDASLVAQTLAADIEANGAPLVYRLDRASAHDAPLVRNLLDAHGILVLHGPPHCPRFYGQHERQNREHRAWADELALLALDEMEPRLRQILAAVNDIWRRRTLVWRTASEVWGARPRLDIDRAGLREEVSERAAHIGQQLQRRGKPADLAQRLAIEQALQTRGYLRQTVGGWC